MTRMVNRSRRLVGVIFAALVAAAIAAGGAQADRPDLVRAVRAGKAASAAQPASPERFERAAARAGDDAVTRPDDRGGTRGPGTVFSTSPLTVSTVSRDGFQWEDATVGAAAMLVGLLLAGGMAFTVRHRRRVILP